MGVVERVVVEGFLDSQPYCTLDGRVLYGSDVEEFVELFFGSDG